MTTTIAIESLRLFGRHGVGAQELTVGNTFVYDVVLKYPFADGAEHDDLDGTLNYATVVDIIKEVNDLPSKLLENVAWRLRRTLMERFPELSGGMIRVAKPTPPIPSVEIGRAAVTIEW